MDDTFFYNKLKKHNGSVSAILGTPEVFEKIPINWHIIITDIKESTKSVNDGMSELVNLIATSSIIAALNIASDSKIDIPFFFGGDGATLLVPESLLDNTMAALMVHRANVKDKFDIDLRVGSFPVATVYEGQNELKIAKVNVNALFSIPIVLGNGLHFAESVIKSNSSAVETQPKDVALRLEGMECRWNKIPPPNTSDEVLCLLVDSLKESEQAIVFKNVLDKIENIYGPHQKRNPISIPKLELNVRLKRIRTELRTKKLKYNFKDLLVAWAETLIGKAWYLSSNSGQKYLTELVQLSDIFVLDGRINMVISGSSEKRKLLVAFLEEEEKMGKLIFGFHSSKESIISCYVRNRKANHIHFVDGGAGGYTQAASMLKIKIKNSTTQ